MADIETSTAAELGRILLVEDCASTATVVQTAFSNVFGLQGRPTIVHVVSLQDAFVEMENSQHEPFDVVLLDLTLSDSAGIDTLNRFRERFGDVAIMVLTGTGDEACGLEAVSHGAQDFLFKDETYPKLLVRHALYARQRKRQELALRDARDRAERMTVQKDKFLSMISHDLRSPLGGMISMLCSLERSWESLSEERRQHFVRQVHASADGMMSVVENLLEISRLQRGLECPRMGFVNAHYLVTAVCARLQSAASVKDLTLNNEVPENARLFVDDVLLGQVLQNLLSNAIKFSRPSGRIDISIAEDAPGTLVVRDRGVGIDPQRCASLFDLGARCSTLGTAGEKGTGLGLPHSYEIVKVMGGVLAVRSEPEKSTEFLVQLPVRKPRLLAIDDDPTVLEFLEHVIGSINVEIIGAGCGAEAEAVLAEGERPDLILVDVLLPGKGGLELLADFKNSAATQTIPVVVITGDTAIETREKAMSLGAADFVSKPLAIEDLIPRVRRFIA